MTELDRCRAWIEAALARGGWTHKFEDIAAGIAENKLQLWPAEKGCLVTEICQFPQRRMLNIWLAGGEIEELARMHDDVIRWAKLQECEGALLTGRKGWERAFAKYGWSPRSVTLEMRF